MMWLLLLGLLLLAPQVSATTYYVGKTGSDANNCSTAQTIGTPKLTVASGLGCLAAGDTLYVRTGTYTERLLETSFGATGTSSNRITVSAYNGETVTIRPTGGGGNVVRFQDASIHHVTIHGFVLDGINAGGQSGASVIYCQSHHLTFSANDITNGDGNGVLCDGDSYQFLNNRVFTNGRYAGYTNSNGMYLEGITSSLIVGNQVYDNECVGIRVWNSGASPKANSNTIQRNVLHDNGFGVGLSGASVCGSGGGGFSIGDADNLVSRNVVYHNYIGAQSPSNSLRTLYYHNTFYDNTADVILDSGATNTQVKNNILYNSVSGLTNNGTGTTTATNQTSNPSFTNAAGGDLSLSSSSTAINAGTDVGLVYNGAAPDIGAFETFVFASCVVEDAEPTKLLITFTNNVHPPLRPATGLTGFTARQNGSNNPVSAAVKRSGTDNIVELTVGAYANGETIDISYSAGNLTDSSLIGNTSNQPYVGTLTNQSCTNNVTGGGSPVTAELHQTAGEFHFIRGAADSPTVLPIGPSGRTAQPGGMIRVLLTVTCTEDDCGTFGMVLRYRKNGGSYTVVPDSFGADQIAFVGTAAITGVPTNGTSIDLADAVEDVPCALIRTSNAIPSVTLNEGVVTACEYAVTFSTSATPGDVYDFQLYKEDGSALTGYDVVPRVRLVPNRMSGFN